MRKVTVKVKVADAQTGQRTQFYTSVGLRTLNVLPRSCGL